MLSINLGFLRDELAKWGRHPAMATPLHHSRLAIASKTRANALMARTQDGWSAGIPRYLIRVIFWPPQMPMAQPSTRMVCGSISRRCPA